MIQVASYNVTRLLKIKNYLRPDDCIMNSPVTEIKQTVKSNKAPRLSGFPCNYVILM